MQTESKVCSLDKSARKEALKENESAGLLHPEIEPFFRLVMSGCTELGGGRQA